MRVDQTVAEQLGNMLPRRLAVLEKRGERLQRLRRRCERLAELETVEVEDQSRNARGEVAPGSDSLEQRSVDEDSQLVAVGANLDNRASVVRAPEDELWDSLGLRGRWAVRVQMLAPALAQLVVVHPLVQEPVELLAHVEQPILRLTPDGATRLGPLQLVVEVEVEVRERLELLTHRERVASVELARHGSASPHYGQTETQELVQSGGNIDDFAAVVRSTRQHRRGGETWEQYTYTSS